MKKIYIIVCLCFLSTPFWAQTIYGHVRSAATTEALEFVQIRNINTGVATRTNLQGAFAIEAVEGKDTLEIQSMGFTTQYVVAQKDVHIDLVMPTIQVDELILSASRTASVRSDAPVAISSISAEQIEANKPTHIHEVLNQVAGVHMIDLGNEQHTMSIRRPIDYGASYLYLEDGLPIRASGIFNHNALLEINMAQTQRIEVIRGPASSLYGSEAIGGAVNFITRKPSTVPTFKLSAQGNTVGYRRGDWRASTTFADKLGVQVSGYYAQQREGVIEHSDFDKLALSLGLTYSLSDYTQLEWNTSYIDYKADMSGALDSADFFGKQYTSNQTFTDRKVHAYRSKLKLTHYWTANSKTNVTAFMRQNNIKQNPSYRIKNDFKPWIPAGDPTLAHGELNENRFQSYGLLAQQHLSWARWQSSLTAGASIEYNPNVYMADYIRINRTPEGVYNQYETTDSALVDYTTKLWNAAAYAQFKFQPVKSLNVIAALRYDRFDYQFDNHLGANAFTAVLDGQNVFSQFTPKIGLTYDLKKQRGLYANFSQGFVPPQVSELYRGQKVPSLKPVYYNSLEIGGWWTFLNQKAKFEWSLYKMDGFNEIISVLQNDGSTLRQNAGETTHQGVEYALTLAPIKDLHFRMSGTYAVHKFVDFTPAGSDFSSNTMPQAPQWVGNAQLTYTPHQVKGLRASLEWQHVDAYYMNPENSKRYGGYNLLNLRLSYAFKGMEIWMHCMNLNNELYATVARATAWGTGYSPGKPRFLTIGLSYEFQAKTK